MHRMMVCGFAAVWLSGCAGLSSFPEDVEEPLGAPVDLASAEPSPEPEPSPVIDTAPFAEPEVEPEPDPVIEPDPVDSGTAAPTPPPTPAPTPAGVSLDAADTCADAVAMSPVGNGVFSSSLAGFSADGLSASCLDYGSWGETGFYKVFLPAGATLQAGYDSYGGDGQVYLLHDCSSGAACLVGADGVPGPGREQVQFTNTSGQDREAYLVVANFSPGASPLGFDIFVDVQ